MNSQSPVNSRRMRIFTISQISKLVLLALVIAIFSVVSFAQTTQPTLGKGVQSHKGIDSIYTSFSESYATLKPEIVANLYTEDAAYLIPNEPIINGKKAILGNFTGFFKYVKERRQTMTISFEISQRRVEENIGYDVGVYTINFSKDGKVVETAKGKFVVVAVIDKDKKWRFQVDSYSDLEPQKNN